MAVNPFEADALRQQIQQATRNLARDINQNAVAWAAAAQAQSVPLSTLAQYVTNAGASYRNIIAQANAFLAANPAAATAACALIGATLADLNAYAAPLSTVANGIATADLSSYAKIITACNQIVAAVPMPPTLYSGV